MWCPSPQVDISARRLRQTGACGPGGGASTASWGSGASAGARRRARQGTAQGAGCGGRGARFSTQGSENPCIPYTLYPIPYTLYLIPYTLYPMPYTLYPIPYTLYPITLYPTTYTLYPMAYILWPISYTLYPLPYNPIPYTLNLKPQTRHPGQRGLRNRGLEERCTVRLSELDIGTYEWGEGPGRRHVRRSLPQL